MFKSKMSKVGALMMAVSLLVSGMAGSALSESGDMIVAIQAVEDGSIHVEQQIPVQQEQGQEVYANTIADTGITVGDQQTMPAPTQAPAVEQAVRQVYRVEFFLNDISLGYVEVNEGDYLLIPDYIPELPGFQFEYWYDYNLYIEQLKEFPYILPGEYLFGSPVTGNLILCPYFTELPQQAAPAQVADQSAQINVQEQPAVVENTQTQQLVNQIMGVPESDLDNSPAEISATSQEQTDALLNKIIHNTDDASPVQPVAYSALSAQQESELIGQIMGDSNADADAPEVSAMSQYQADALIEQIMNTASPMLDEETQIIEEPVVAPSDDHAQQIIEQIVGGSAEEVSEDSPAQGITVQDVLANNNFVVDDPISEEKPITVVSDEQIQNLINSIQANDGALENTQEDETTVSDDLIQTAVDDQVQPISDESTDDESTDALPEEEEPIDDAQILDGEPASDSMDEIAPIDEDNLIDEDDLIVDIQDEDVALAGPAALQTTAPAPSVKVVYEYEGDQILPGTLVTVRAELLNVPQGVSASFQWLNNASGDFEEIGQTNQSFSFVADEWNTNCEYLVNVTLG